jgi:2-polyprenyl-3-methyl-5-hydroxy-6-metoxy-1,4-benzoquinol methylase
VLWRLGRNPLSAAGPRREFADPLEPQPPLYRSPTLQALVSRLSSEGAYHILDLGVASGANVEFFSRFSCRLQIADLPEALASEKLRPLLTADPVAAFRMILPVSWAPFDVVLAWDVLNYLTREQFDSLAAHVGSLCRPGALVLAFVSTTKEMSSAPLVFKIVDDQTLLLWKQTTAVRPSPRFPPAEVGRLMSGFAVVQSVVMRHGVQEYLFVRR